MNARLAGIPTATAADDSLCIAWNTAAEPEWRRLAAGADRSAIEQSWAFGEAVAACHGLVVERGIVRRDGPAIALVQAIRRRIPAASIVRITSGPLLLPDNQPDIQPVRAGIFAAIWRHFLRRRREFLFWMPELEDGPASQTLMRTTGLRRVVTGYGTVIIDLGADEATLRAELDGKWRNMLVAAERETMRIERVPRGRHLDALLDHYDALRKARRFGGATGAFIRTLCKGATEDEVVTLAAFDGLTMIAGVLAVRHGATATYYAGWTSEAGRERRAHNLLLWRAMIELRRGGTRWLDLGGVSATAPGIARFKLGTGGRLVTLAGTWF